MLNDEQSLINSKLMKIKSLILLTLTFFVFSEVPVIAQNDTIADVAEQGTIVYGCPMHPEITSEKPGSCPECGMALTQKQSSSSAHKMGTMMCSMHEMMGMNHKDDEKKKKSAKMMGIGVGAIMVAMMAVMVIVGGNWLTRWTVGCKMLNQLKF